MRILLVDDDSVYVNLLAEVLIYHFYTVVTALDGEAALNLLRKEGLIWLFRMSVCRE